MKGLRFLLLEDSSLDAELISTLLEEGGMEFELVLVQTRTEFLTALKTQAFDLILSDYSLPSFDGISALKIARQLCPEVPFIFVSATLGEELAIETLKSGATDYVLKQRLARLVPAVERALRETQQRRQHHQAAAALKLAEDRHRILFERSPLGIWLVDVEEHTFVEFNTQAHQQLGYSQEEFSRLKIEEIEAIETPEEVWAHRDRIFQQGFDQFETKHRTKSGQLRDVLVTVQRLTIGNRAYLHGIVQDVTDRKQSEAALHRAYERIGERSNELETVNEVLQNTLDELSLAEEELQEQNLQLKTERQRYQDLFDFAPDGYLVTDTNGRIQKANRAIAARLATDASFLIGKPLVLFVPEQTQSVYYQQLSRLLATQQIQTWELSLQTQQGDSFPVEVTVDRIYSATAQLIGLRWVIRDISERKQAAAALAESEAKFRSLIQNSSDVVSIVDRQGVIQYVSASVERIFGYSPEEVIGKNQFNFIHPNDAAKLVPLFEELAQTPNMQTTVEYCVRHHNGTWRYFESSVSNRFDDPTIAGIVINSRETTERRQAETALRQSEARFRRLVEFNLIGCIFWDADGTILDANDAFLQMVGYSREDLQAGRINWKAMTPVEQLPLSAEAIAQMQQNGAAETLEKDYIRKDGSRVSVLLGGVMFEGSQHQGVSFVLNLTERKRAEQVLQERSQRLQLLFETTSDLLSTEQPLTLMNNLFVRLSAQMDLQFYLQYLVEQQGDRSVLRLVSHGGISEANTQPLQQLEFGQQICGLVAQEQHQIVLSQVQQSTQPNTQIIRALGVTAYASQPLIVQGRLLGTLAFASLTRNRFSSEETALLQATSDQVAVALERANLITSLQQQTEQLTQANRIKDEFLAVLSHELRTPLNPILGWAKMLRTRRCDEATVARALEIIERNAKIQTQLIEDLLDVSRILQGKVSLTITPVDLTQTIDAALETVRLAAEAKSINLRCIMTEGEQATEFPQTSAANLGEPAQAMPNSRFWVLGDSSRLQQIVWNLLSNAVKFTPSGGDVTIYLGQTKDKGKSTAENQLNLLSEATAYSSTEATATALAMPDASEYAELTVTDTGKGIKPDFLPYVFDYFRQADGSTTRAFGGLGLGLAIVRHLVELHGGIIGVNSSGEGQGATFIVKLPLLKPDDSRIRQAKSLLNSASLSHPSLRGIRVLAVDDEKDALDFVTFLLKQQGAEVLAVSSADEVLQTIESFKPSILISDIAMPGKDGYTLLHQVRSLGGGRGGDIPAIALTAYARDEDRDRAIAAGFQKHLVKPLEPLELLSAVIELIHHSGF